MTSRSRAEAALMVCAVLASHSPQAHAVGCLSGGAAGAVGGCLLGHKIAVNRKRKAA